MMAAATASADLSSKICLPLRCFSLSSNVIFSGVLVKILVFPDRDGPDVFQGAAFVKGSKAAGEIYGLEEDTIA